MAGEARTAPAGQLGLRRPVALATGLVAALVFWFVGRTTTLEARNDTVASARQVARQLADRLIDRPAAARSHLELAASCWQDAGAAGIYAPAARSPGTLVREAHSGRVSLPATVATPTADERIDVLEFDDAVLAFHPLGNTGRWAAVGRSMLRAQAEARWTLVGWFAALLSLVLTATFITASRERRLSNDLERLTSGMARITNGHLGERLDPDRSDALGTAARRFNNMARAVEDSRRESREQARALELRVADRTAALQRATHTLRTLDQARDAFLANVSHELRTPLTAILASTEILRDLEQVDTTTLGEFVSIIEHESRRLLDLIGSALTVAETESTLPTLRRLPTDLVRLCDEVVARFSTRCAERGVTVVRRFDVLDPVVRCDADHIAAALECLLDNATKFSPRGGSVDLTLRDEPDGVMIEVRDEGPGVPTEDQRRIFERFTQAGSVLTDKPRGFGLGLPLSRRIAQAHGGAVEYVDEPGWGACFVLRLPTEPVRRTGHAEANRRQSRPRTDAPTQSAGSRSA